MLEHSILKTISYFDLFSFPLTAEEVFYYLWKEKASFEETRKMLEKMAQENKLNFENGFYSLSNANLAVKREESVLPTEHKLKIARRAASLIRGVPFLKAIFVCNSVASAGAKPSSDIDFFIVTTPQRIWTVRFFSNIILRLFRLRTYGLNSADRVCLSFYVSSDQLDFWPLRISDEDIYLAVWTSQLHAVYDPEKLFEKIQISNQWIRSLFLNSFSSGVMPNVQYRGKIKYLLEKVLARKIGDKIESYLKKLQWIKLKDSIKEQAEKNGRGVVLKEGILKFHENDARKNLVFEWENNFKNYVN